MQDKTLRDAYMEVVANQLETGKPPETRATLDRLVAAGCSNAEAMQLIAAVARREMQATLARGRQFPNAHYVALLAKLPEID